MEATQTTTCRNCGRTGYGKHCTNCGQKLSVERITVHGILHEVFHYFTHLDKGFGYTLKQLATRPGYMQKEYLEGKRTRHQKPFSMFFLCGTICGLAYYFINLAYHNLYQRDTVSEANFFRHYFVLLQAVMMPFYTFVLWFLFRKATFNYAESLVLTLYSLSFVFLVLIFINLVKLAFPDFDTRYIEVVFLVFYNNITNIRFFGDKKWIVVAKTIVMLAVAYVSSQLVSQAVIKLLS